MACEDLLYQRRSRALHSENEDWALRVAAGSRACLEEFLREDGHARSHMFRERLRVVIDVHSLDRIRPRVVFERLLVSGLPAQHPAQREVNIHAILAGHVRARELALHFLDFDVAEAVIEAGKTPVWLPEGRAKRESVAIG